MIKPGNQHLTRMEYVFVIYARGETMTFGELKRLLKKTGCYLHHQGSRHEIWVNPKTGRRFPVGRHDSKEVCDGTLKSIKSDAGLDQYP